MSEKKKLKAMKRHLNITTTTTTAVIDEDISHPSNLKSDLTYSVAVATPPTPSSSSSNTSFPVTNQGNYNLYSA